MTDNDLMAYCRVMFLVVLSVSTPSFAAEFLEDVQSGQCPGGNCHLGANPVLDETALEIGQLEQAKDFPFLPTRWPSAQLQAEEDLKSILPNTCLGGKERNLEIHVAGEDHRPEYSQPLRESLKAAQEKKELYYFSEGVQGSSSGQGLEIPHTHILGGLALLAYQSEIWQMAAKQAEDSQKGLWASIKSAAGLKVSAPYFANQAHQITERLDDIVERFDPLPEWAFNSITNSIKDPKLAETLKGYLRELALERRTLKAHEISYADSPEQGTLNILREADGNIGALKANIRMKLSEYAKREPEAFWQIGHHIFLAPLKSEEFLSEMLSQGQVQPAWLKELGAAFSASLENGDKAKRRGASELVYSLMPLHFRNFQMLRALVKEICEKKDAMRPVTVVVGGAHAPALEWMLKRTFPSAKVTIKVAPPGPTDRS